MVFSSIEFLWFFMPIALGAYFLSPPAQRNLVLVVASFIFYAWGAHAFVLVFAGSVVFNYWAARLISELKVRERRRVLRWAVRGAVVANVLLLVTWKYVTFLTRTLNSAIGLTGDHQLIGIPQIALPIGISFFTFHAISYVVDTSKGTASPVRRLRDFAQYMAFFPQLIAGPIIRYHEIAHQLTAAPARSQRCNDLADGFPRFALGLSKKVLVADQVAPIANAAFGSTAHITTPSAWLGALAYAVQIYFDFSGYSDMAIGIARIFGFRFPENFNRPYSSVSLTDFWRRWHMSLSRWLRDYVYIPLGGSRHGRFGTTFNLLFVFLVTGIWHGAAWTFVLWGLYHGVLLVAERITGVARWADERLPIPRRALTLLFVVIGWVLFRASTLGDAARMYSGMIPVHFGAVAPSIHQALNRESVAALVIGLSSVLLPRGFVLGRTVLDGRWAGGALAARAAVIVIMPLAAITVAAGSFSPFLYFRF